MDVLAVGHRYYRGPGRRTFYEKRVTDHFDGLPKSKKVLAGLEGSYFQYSNDFWENIRQGLNRNRMDYAHLESLPPARTLLELENLLESAIQREAEKPGEGHRVLSFRGRVVSEDTKDQLRPCVNQLLKTNARPDLQILQQWKNAVSVSRSLEMFDHAEKNGFTHLVLGAHHAKDLDYFGKNIRLHTLYRSSHRDWRTRIDDYHRHENLMQGLVALIRQKL